MSQPEELYCCDDYRHFLQYLLTNKPPEAEENKLIDISPHPPYGSKQARRAAKERAAQRFVSSTIENVFTNYILII